MSSDPNENWPKFPDPTVSENLTLNQATDEESLDAAWTELRVLPEKVSSIPRSTEEDIRKFVVEFLSGAIFTSAQVHESSMVPTIFMPVAFGAFKDHTDEALKEVGILWAYMSEAMPRSVNGYPMFGSMRVMHKDDWARASAAIHREQDRQKTIEI